MTRGRVKEYVKAVQELKEYWAMLNNVKERIDSVRKALDRALDWECRFKYKYIKYLDEESIMVDFNPNIWPDRSLIILCVAGLISAHQKVIMLWNGLSDDVKTRIKPPDSLEPYEEGQLNI